MNGIKTKGDKWKKYGGWIFLAPPLLQLLWDGTMRSVDYAHSVDFGFFLEVYTFGGLMAIVALVCAGKIGHR